MVFASMVINYVDRQTISALAPVLQQEFAWTQTDFAVLLLAFRIGYTLSQAVAGRLLDIFGARLGLAVSVAFYSAVAALTSSVQGVAGFRACRFLLGTGEAAGWPAAIKVSSQWFSPRERGWVVALFDGGTALGGALVSFIALGIYRWFDDWRAVFLLTGSLGAIWIVAWLAVYRASSDVSRGPVHVAPELPQAGRQAELPTATWRQLLARRQMWGILLGRFLLDPYWFFVAEWFPLYLQSRGFSLAESILGAAGPQIASVFGNFAGGALSGHLMRRGWRVGAARRAVLALFGPSMALLALSLVVSDYATLIALFSYGNFAYAACSTMFLSLPADVFHSRAVASASGLAGTAAGLGTLVSTWLTGQIADRFSFGPVVLAASLVPCLAAAAFVALVRAPKQPAADGLVTDF